MNKSFNKIKLGELTEIIAGGDKPKIFSENKTSINTVPVFANAEGNNGLLGYTNLPRIIEPAVTISARGSKVGFAALRKQPFFPIVRLLTLIPKKDKLDVDFLFYNLKLNRQNGTGSGQPQITIPEISEKIISVPHLSTQQKIASVLSALDSKIELNNRINAELEAMAKTLYDYWFVQFDFPDKNGKPYKSTGGKMVWNEELKREIPEGWEVQNLSKIANITTGKLDSNAEVIGAAYPFYTCASDPSTTDTFAFDDTVILVAGNNAAGNFHINRHKGKFNAYQRTYIFTSKNQKELEYLYQVLKTETKALKSQGKGSQTKFLTIGMLTGINTFTKTSIMNKYNDVVKPMYEQQVVIRMQNQKLTELRDWLLPMLMNGQVTVREAEERLSMAAEPSEKYGK